MRDPYQILGVSRAANADDIKRAFRRLAKELHPDLNPNHTSLDLSFKEVSSAYEILSDPGRRARYDRGEIDAAGNERPETQRARGGRWYSKPAEKHPPDTDAGLFSDFSTRKRSPRPNGETTDPPHQETDGRPRGSDVTYSLTIPFLEAALGTRRRIALTSGKSLDVVIPPGTDDQQKLRLKGQGLAAAGGGPPGDAIIEVWVEPHPFFSRKGTDIHLDVPVTIREAILGASIRVPTVGGSVSLRIPPHSNTDTVLRLKGKGILNQSTRGIGDQYVKLKVVLPEFPDQELTRLVKSWSQSMQHNPRRKAGLE